MRYTSLSALLLIGCASHAAHAATVTLIAAADQNNLQYADGATTWAQEVFVGVHHIDPPGVRGVVIPFQLPSLPAGTEEWSVVDASFSFEMLGAFGNVNYGVALYSGHLSDDAAIDESFYFLGDNIDAEATLVERSILSPSDQPSVVSTSANGSAALSDYLNELYAHPGNIGRFFSLRLNPDRSDLNGSSGFWVLLADPYNQPGDPDYVYLGNSPSIAITFAVVPEPTAAIALFPSIACALLHRRTRRTHCQR